MLNLPNAITLLRIATVPVVMAMMSWQPVNWAWPAAILFGVAAATDFVDGYLARALNQVTMLGKFLDPLADKLLVLGPMVCLLRLERISVWLAFVVLGRELIVSTLRTVAIGQGLVIAARSLGKQKTVFQLVGLGLLIVGRPVGPEAWSFRPDLEVVGAVLLWIGAVLGLVSAVDYFAVFFRTRPESGDSDPRTGPAAPDDRQPPSAVDKGRALGHVAAPSRE